MACSSAAVNRWPFSSRKRTRTTKAVRLFPSTKGWLRIIPTVISGRHVYCVRSVTVRVELVRTSKSGLRQPYVPDASSTTVERQKTTMQCENITLLNPDGFSQLASEWRVLR